MKKVVEIYNSNQAVKRFLDVSDDWVQPPSKYGISFDTRFLDIIEESKPAFDSKIEKLTPQIRIENDNYIKYFVKQNLTQEEIDSAAQFLRESQSRTLLQDREAIEALWFMLKMERKQRLGNPLTQIEQDKYAKIAGILNQIEAL